MMQKLYTLTLLLFAVMSLPLHGENISAIVYNGTGAPLEDRHTALTLAGIVNREEPRLYLRNVYQAWSFNQTDQTWQNIYTEDGNVSFTEISDINQLIDHFKEDLNGAITYNPSLTYGNFEGQNFRWQAEVAAMIGGLTNCIPLPYWNTSTDIERPDSVWVADPFHGQEPIRISAKLELESHPWNQSSLTQEERYFTILNWALEHLLERTNPEKFYLREITDWAVSQRMFQLNLAGTETLNFYSLSDEKAEKIEQVMSYLRDSNPGQIFHVYGWMRPEPLVQWISAWGGSFHETLLSNLSWHHIFPADEQFSYERPSALSPEDVELDNQKLYVLFIGSEGDAGNWNMGFQAGAWLSPLRGQVPVGWGFNLHFFKEFPFLGQYYFRTATQNDGFISVTNPLGYAYADMFPDDFLPNAIERSQWKLQQFNIPSVYAYKHYNGAGVSTYRGVEISNNYDFEKLGDFAQQTGTDLTFLFDPALQTQQAYTQYGGLLYNHVNDNTFYGNVTDMEATAQEIVGKLIEAPRPAFLLAGYQRFRQDGTSVGAGNPADITLPRLKNIMELVQANATIGHMVEFVTPEKFTILLNKKLATSNTPQDKYLLTNNLHVYADAFNQLHVQGYLPHSDNLVISIYDISGKQIMQTRQNFAAGNLSYQLPGTNLTKGMYVVNINGNRTFLSRKIIF